ncbi:probable L-type lectin-domain containing receptor kinase S.7 [Andrographis paniculata]|uniref:probable L-type lectin-domain containing receptor kinase S.7 n=1 Tax=Andrographis paniculata TaxID=175694 RepID=UPI0021E8FF29|nr:probable L-type lectin-domain containing receptor kinase S.7 [Andrographis paniculata]
MNKTFLFTFLIPFSISIAFSQDDSDLNLDFPNFSIRNFTLLGDSYLRSGVAGLTRDVQVPSSSAGSVIYNRPIRFSDTASFSTRFAFSIENINPSSPGDGLTFFISGDNQTLGSPGAFLGLVNASAVRPPENNSSFIAVEFDTRLDPHFHDPDDNHVGFDIDSLISFKSANSMLAGVDLKSGNTITAWIDYSGENHNLQVFLSYTNSKPPNPLLTVDVNLSDHLNHSMFAGFTASTEGSTERHCITNWSFSTHSFRPRRSPNNVSETSVPNPPEKSIPVTDSGSRLHRRIGFGLGIGFPAFFCAVLIVFGFFSIKKWRGFKKEKNLKAEVMAGPREFSYKEINAATAGFDKARILGHGAFGTVYKAFFADGMISAVKRSKHPREGKVEFLSELSIIACLRHKNLVQLQGWCVRKDDLLLVYEFMPHGSLDKALHHDESGNGEAATTTILKWPQRYNIAVGLASALTYLHQECEQQVIHRDIKSSNIMLDGNYNARLGDFGLARLMDHGDKSPVSTLTAGTMGYLAPEYLQYGKATDKTDVFSYGVVILELACGRRPIEREGEGQRMVNLVDWVWKLHSEGRIVSAADGRMKGEFDQQEMKRLLLVGLSCANPDGAARPSMRRVFQILSDEAEPVVVPKVKPSLTFLNSLPLSIDEIVEECDREDREPSPPFPETGAGKIG